MKKTLFKSVLCATLFVGALTSCNDIEDLYNPELARERAQEAFGLPIDPNHDWNMTSVVTANVTLNEDALSDYSFRIYSGNPLDKNSGAVILAEHPVKTDAQGKASATFKFEMPSYLKQVYVGRVDNHGRRMVGIANIENSTISKSFGVASAATRAGEDTNALYTMDNNDLYSETDVTTLLASAKVLGQNGNNDLTGVTKVQGTFDGSNLNYYLNAQNIKQNVLIIDNGATLNITESRQYAHIDIVVANGGTLNISNEFKLNPRCRLIVMPGGVVNHTQAGSNGRSFNFEHDYTNSSCIYNAGTINMVGTTYISNGGKFYNASTGVVVADIITTASANDVICNYGKIEANAITSNNGNGEQGTLHNGCLIRCENIRVFNLNLAANSALENIKYLYAQNIYLRENTIVKVDGTFEAKSNLTFNYCGVNNGRALFSADNMLLSCSNITVNNQSNIFIERNTVSVPDGSDNTVEFYDNKLMNAAGSVSLVGKANVVILPDDVPQTQADCIGNGNIPDDYEQETAQPTIFTYAFEDTDKGAGDYDFNDVVIKCSVPMNNKITVTLAAVGAQKRINLMFQLRDNDGNVIAGTTRKVFEEEVHAAFPNGATENFINTLVGNPTFECPSVEIEVPEGFSYSKHGDFFINVVKSSATSHLPQFTDNYEGIGVPYAILVPVDWRYPQEWQRVNTAYDKFVNWAEDVTKDIDWYTTPTDASKVY